MRALQVVDPIGPDGVVLGERADPDPSDGVLVEVHAAGVGFVDTLLARGAYQVRPDPPFVPGLEVAGVVRAAPTGSGFATGDRVAGHVMTGAFAELVTVAPHLLAPMPDGDFATAVAGVVNHHTAHFALTRRARLQPGEAVLVHGAGGGLGGAAVQVARALGARVLAVAGSAGGRQLAARSGAAEVHGHDDWFDAVRAAGGVDVVVDPVGGDRFEQSLRCLAPEGRLLTVGFTSGRIPQAAANRLLLRNAGVLGAAWREFLTVDPGLFRRTAEALAGLGVRPLVGASYPLAEGAAALRAIEERTADGKVVLLI